MANPGGLPENNAHPGHFNVFERGLHTINSPFRRRDFYKISYIIGQGRIHYADKWMEINQPALIVSNPFVPYAWEMLDAPPAGWFCLFDEAFLQPAERAGAFATSPLFQSGGSPVFFPDAAQQEELSFLFRKMSQEMQSDYAHKFDVLRNYLHLLLHETLKMSPATGFQRQFNAAARITNLFMDLLERQFPVDRADTALPLRSAQDFATHLNVHVNHLNRAVKESTGKTTSAHIAARVVQEANILLQHSGWTIAEIAYSLGFEYPAYFTRFYRKHTGHVPLERKQGIV